MNFTFLSIHLRLKAQIYLFIYFCLQHLPYSAATFPVEMAKDSRECHGSWRPAWSRDLCMWYPSPHRPQRSL